MADVSDDDRLVNGVTFRKLRDIDDLELAEALRDFLRKESIGAAIIGDEELQHLPPEERFRQAEQMNLQLRLEVPLELYEESERLLKELEKKVFEGG